VQSDLRKKYGFQDNLKNKTCESNHKISSTKLKFEEEYFETKTRIEFENLVSSRFDKYKLVTIKRRFYDLRKKYGPQDEAEKEFVLNYVKDNKSKPKSSAKVFSKQLKKKPSLLKMLLLKDMKKMGCKLKDEFLHRYGFTDIEINWLKENEEI